MPSFSRPLEESLHRAVAYANQRKHEYATLEHLLLSLTDDDDAAGVMRACDVDLNALKKSLVNYLDVELASLVVDDEDDAKPTAGFQRVIQRAVIHVQSSGREEVTGANVLVAIFSERESHAAYFPARAGHDPLRRGELHRPRHRQEGRRLGSQERQGRQRRLELDRGRRREAQHQDRRRGPRGLLRLSLIHI